MSVSRRPRSAVADAGPASAARSTARGIRGLGSSTTRVNFRLLARCDGAIWRAQHQLWIDGSSATRAPAGVVVSWRGCEKARRRSTNRDVKDMDDRSYRK